VKTVATDGTGLVELSQALAEHAKHLATNNLLEPARRRRAAARLRALALQGLGQALDAKGKHGPRFADLHARVARGELSPRKAAAELLHAFGM
jgi:putative protein kinase ArgK-like GTPase of G3E family